jgi:anti-sigma regulatory factor (Ser/Thr protein kinase)
MPSKNTSLIAVSGDIKRAYISVSDIAKSMGFSKIEISSLANAVSEIATNVIKYATKGSMHVRVSKNRRVLEITIEDKGPGIRKLEKAQQEGYSTGLGLGIGLPAAKRAMDEFVITSKVGKGTKVVMKKYLPIPHEEIEYGVFSISKPGELVNGDAYVIREFNGDSVLLAVIDGEGHGEKANRAMVLVKDIIEEQYKVPLDEIMKNCHQSLIKKNGRRAVVGLCRLSPHRLEYLGIGDTDIMVIADGEGYLSPYSRPGQLGTGYKGLKKMSEKNVRKISTSEFLPTLKVQKFTCPREVTIILWSDGIQRRFRKEDLPLDEKAQKIASVIADKFIRGTDDATVLVAKRKK